MYKKTLFIQGLLLFCTALSISCSKAPNTPVQNGANTAVPINSYQVTQEKVTGIDTYPGTVVPLHHVELRPQVNGYITQIFVQDGQKISKGQKLYEIDRTKYQATYNQAQAALESAKANLQKVQKDVERYQNLDKQNAIARQRVDYALTDLRTAQAGLASAEASLSGAATDLRYSLITSPLTGVIGISQVKVGSQVSSGQPLLNTVSTDDPIAVDFVISQEEIPRFTVLRQQNIPVDSLFTLQFANGSVYTYPGKIIAIDRAVDPQTGSIAIRLQFPNPSRRLIAGMSAVVRVLNKDIGEQVVIPFKAVTEQLGEYYAFVIEGDSVNQRKLELGTQIGDRIVVRNGLQSGETIVLQGIQRLRQGSKVSLETVSPSAMR
jgi:membrane fusion protein (multidrug efflux system)